MIPSSIPPAAGQPLQPVDVAEWLRVRRPPPPDFVTTLDRLPPNLSPMVQAALPPGRPFKGALVLPAEFYARPKSAWEFAPERALVFLRDAVLLALAPGPDTPARVTLLDASGLLYTRSSLVLLYGLLELKADCAGAEQAGAVRIEYNSVIWETYRSSLAAFVSAANGPHVPTGDDVRAGNAEILKTLPYKFANGLQYNGLTPGERLQAAVFQGEIREGRWLFSKQVTPNTVLALTDQKVVIIEEVLSLALHPSPKGEPGWGFTYIPRNRVAGMAFVPGPRYAELQLRVEWGSAAEERTIVLDREVSTGWQRAWEGR